MTKTTHRQPLRFTAKKDADFGPAGPLGDNPLPAETTECTNCGHDNDFTNDLTCKSCGWGNSPKWDA